MFVNQNIEPKVELKEYTFFLSKGTAVKRRQTKICLTSKFEQRKSFFKILKVSQGRIEKSLEIYFRISCGRFRCGEWNRFNLVWCVCSKLDWERFVSNDPLSLQTAWTYCQYFKKKKKIKSPFSPPTIRWPEDTKLNGVHEGFRALLRRESWR